MTTNSPTQMLEDEHLVIAKVVGAAPVLADRLEAGQLVDVETLLDVVEFMRIFADKCHHGKEEELLFPALEEVGIKREGGPIGVMLEEHERGREYVRTMKRAMSHHRAGQDPGATGFIREARGYIDLLDQHIDKEDNVLFPMAEKQLAETTQAELAEGFERIEVEKIGAGKHEEFHRMLDHLKGVYL